MDKKYIVFDWDNTLADTYFHMKMSMDQTLLCLRNMGLKLEAKTIGEYWNYSLCDIFSDLPQNWVKIGRKIYYANYKRCKPKTVNLFSSAYELINFLYNQNKKIYIISNKNESDLLEEIKSAGLINCFENIHGISNKKICKPSPQVFSLVIGHDPSPIDVLFIGDSFIDRETAKNFGCKFICINNLTISTGNQRDSITIDTLLNIFTKIYL